MAAVPPSLHSLIINSPDIFGPLPPELFINGTFFLDPVIFGDVACERQTLLVTKQKSIVFHPSTREPLTPDQMKIFQDINWERRGLVIASLINAMTSYGRYLSKKDVWTSDDAHYLIDILRSLQLNSFYDCLQEININLAHMLSLQFHKLQIHIPILLENNAAGIQILFCLCQISNRWRDFYGYHLLLEMAKCQELFPVLLPMMPFLGDKLLRAEHLGEDECITHLLQLQQQSIPVVHEGVTHPLFLGLGIEVPEARQDEVVQMVREACQPFGDFNPKIRLHKTNDRHHRSFVYINYKTKEQANAAFKALDGKRIKDLGPIMARLSADDE